MNGRNNDLTILWLSFSLAILVAVSAFVGLSSPGFYARETLNWQAQSEGQDMADLFLATPALLLTAAGAYLKRKGALLAWAGAVAYLLYTFLIYCFSVHFNSLFLVYCFALGLSFYSLLWFIYTQIKEPDSATRFSEVPRRLISIYLVVLSVLFYFLWLSEIVPAIVNKEVPLSVKQTGLFTNAVHVIDLSVVLPGIFISGIFLWKKRRVGYIMAPVWLTFFILMDLTIGGLVLVMKGKGVDADMVLAGVMGGLALLSAVMLAVYIRKMKQE